MRRFLVIICVFLGLGAVPAHAAEATVVRSVAELRKLGISVEHLRNDTPGASVQVGSLFAPGKALGEYVRTECVVLSAAVDADRLPLADAGALESATVVRRSESEKERSIFLVLGRDVTKSHLAFQFAVREGGTTKTVRYLFPVSSIVRGK